MTLGLMNIESGPFSDFLKDGSWTSDLKGRKILKPESAIMWTLPGSTCCASGDQLNVELDRVGVCRILDVSDD
jgi:hypothetical protein